MRVLESNAHVYGSENFSTTFGSTGFMDGPVANVRFLELILQT